MTGLIQTLRAGSPRVLAVALILGGISSVVHAQDVLAIVHEPDRPLTSINIDSGVSQRLLPTNLTPEKTAWDPVHRRLFVASSESPGAITAIHLASGFVATLPLPQPSVRAAALHYDEATNRLLVVAGGGGFRLLSFDLNTGLPEILLTLPHSSLQPPSAFDPVTQRLFLIAGPQVEGRLVTVDIGNRTAATAFPFGQRLTFLEYDPSTGKLVTLVESRTISGTYALSALDPATRALEPLFTVLSQGQPLVSSFDALKRRLIYFEQFPASPTLVVADLPSLTSRRVDVSTRVLALELDNQVTAVPALSRFATVMLAITFAVAAAVRIGKCGI